MQPNCGNDKCYNQYGLAIIVSNNCECLGVSQQLEVSAHADGVVT